MRLAGAEFYAQVSEGAFDRRGFAACQTREIELNWNETERCQRSRTTPGFARKRSSSERTPSNLILQTESSKIRGHHVCGAAYGFPKP